jgi:hypothetical protein
MAKNVYLYCLTALTILLCASAATAQVRFRFDSDAIWELILDGKNMQLHILHRSILPGNSEQKYIIKVDDFTGELILDENQMVSIKWVQEELETSCNGFLMEGGVQMGGTFRSRNAKGAWYASTPPHRIDRTNLGKDSDDLSMRYKRSLQGKNLIIEELIKEMEALYAKNAYLENKLSETTFAFSPYECPETSGFPLSKKALAKLFPSNDKFFANVISYKFPQAPEGGFNESLSNLTKQLKRILVLGFGAENEKLCSQQITAYCGENLLCDIFFKQRAIFLMMGGEE